MLTVAILLNGQPIMARSVVNQLETNDRGETRYRCDDGRDLWHRRDAGAVPLAIAMLETIEPPPSMDGRGRRLADAERPGHRGHADRGDRGRSHDPSSTPPSPGVTPSV